MRPSALCHSKNHPQTGLFRARENQGHLSRKPMDRLPKFCFIVLAFLVFWTGTATAARPARITNMTVNSINNSLLLYFDVENAFNEKLAIAVNSGVNISFSYPVNIYLDKKLWKDVPVAQLDLINTIKYDTLKKEYIVTRSWRNAEPVKVSTFEEAALLMTRVDGLNLAQVKGLVKGQTYKIRIKARMNKVARPKYLKFVLFFLNSWKLETRWNAVSFVY